MSTVHCWRVESCQPSRRTLATIFQRFSAVLNGDRARGARGANFAEVLGGVLCRVRGDRARGALFF